MGEQLIVQGTWEVEMRAEQLGQKGLVDGLWPEGSKDHLLLSSKGTVEVGWGWGSSLLLSDILRVSSVPHN